MSKSKKSESGSSAGDVLSFEGALDQLETTVGRLEEGEMPLEEALELFEKGVSLSRQCAATLDAAEKRIEILVAARDDAESGRVEAFETDDFEELDDLEEDDASEDVDE